MKRLFLISFFILIRVALFAQQIEHKIFTLYPEDNSTLTPDYAIPGQKIRIILHYDICIRYEGLRRDVSPLDTFVYLMKMHPGWKIELASHGDCRSSKAYNDSLTQRRADTAKAYMVRKGIPSNRIVARGYGERKLLNNCGCEDGKGPGMDCSEEQHAVNRRTEFIILENSEIPDPVRFDVNCAKPGQKLFMNVQYDLDKSGIRNDSKKVLDSFINLMQNHVGWKVEISSHTDCRSSYAYNDTLSQKRADTIVAYFIKKGIAKERLVAKGYGERKLLNDCRCENGKGPGMDCMEAEHQQNRRTEFTILENTEDCGEYYKKLALMKCKEFSNISSPCAKEGEYIRTYKFTNLGGTNYFYALREQFLDSLVQLFKQHKKWKIEIREFDDSRYGAEWDDSTTEIGAKNIQSYLVSKGISKKRLSAKGYGQRDLLEEYPKFENKNIYNHYEHWINRRIEFVILKNDEICK